MRNIRALNVYTDATTSCAACRSRSRSMAQRCPRWPWSWQRARKAPRRSASADGAVTLAGYRIPTAVPNTMTLNFEGGADDIPTYSLADLRACAEQGRRGLLSPPFRREGRTRRHPARCRRPQAHLETLRDRPGGRPGGALRARGAAGGRPVRAGFDRRRVCACDGRQQSDPPRRAARARADRQHRGSRRVRRADGSGGTGCWLRSPPRLAYLGLAAAVDGRRHRGLHARPRASACRAADRRASRARRDHRLPACHSRQGQAPAAPELRALSRARGDREADGVTQAAGARRRDAQRHGVLLGSRRVLVIRRDDDAARSGGTDEHVFRGDDRDHRGARRIRRQVYRRRDRGGFRRAARRPRSCGPCGARGDSLQQAAARTQSHRGRIQGSRNSGAASA